MKKVAVFGGTFNPIHNGHINLCLECNKILQFDEIVLIPTNIPPHKECFDLASNQDRLNMIKLAIEGQSLFSVNDIEYKMSGKSYTYNTLIELNSTEQMECFFIMGSDMFLMFDEWYRYEDILEICTIVVGARNNNEYENLLNEKKIKYKNSDKIIIVNVNVLNISSTEIRNKIRNKQDASVFIDDRVYEYINSKKLYN